MIRLTAVVMAITAAQPPAATQPEVKLGTVRFPVSCSASAQPRFNRAVALLHSFAFGPAGQEFQAVLRADSGCAMAHWGLALTAWGNPFAAGLKSPAQLERGLAAVQRARQLAGASDRERDYIEAAAKLFERPDSLSQQARLLAYRDALAGLVARQPADTEAAIFHALALAISADPADKTYASQLQAGALLERLVARLPDHPGLAHYLIHTYDLPSLAARATRAAERYAEIAPTISHAQHMPSHTYTRVGHWKESVASNRASAEAARREQSTAEELHANDYLVYAHLQLGQDRAALVLLQALPEVIARFDPLSQASAAPPSAGYYAIAAIPARYALERGAWADAARLEVRRSPLAWVDAVTWFAKGLGAARSGDTGSAREAATQLGTLQEKLAQAREGYWSEQVRIQRDATLAWLALATGRRDEALATMRGAADAEARTEKNAITPGPLAPARELLGEMLLEVGQSEAALAAFEATLEHEPNRFRALAGAGRAALAAGDRAKARQYYAELLRLGAGADEPKRPELVEAARLRPDS